MENKIKCVVVSSVAILFSFIIFSVAEPVSAAPLTTKQKGSANIEMSIPAATIEDIKELIRDAESGKIDPSKVRSVKKSLNNLGIGADVTKGENTGDPTKVSIDVPNSALEMIKGVIRDVKKGKLDMARAKALKKFLQNTKLEKFFASNDKEVWDKLRKIYKDIDFNKMDIDKDTLKSIKAAVKNFNLEKLDNAILLGRLKEALKAVDSAYKSSGTGTELVTSGPGNAAGGKRAVAVGSDNTAGGKHAVAIGSDNSVSGKESVAVGHKNIVTGEQSIAIGTGNMVTGDHSGAFGDPSIINGSNSYSVGNNNTVSAESKNTFVLGNDVNITGSNTVVLGGSADGTTMNVSGSNSVVLGAGSDGTQDNVVSVGNTGSERRIVHVADGRVEDGSTDAVNGGQIYNIAKELSEDIGRVGAKSAALAGLHPLSMENGQKWNVAVSMGHYGNENAGALGLFFRPDERVIFSLGGTIGSGSTMMNIGASFALDKASGNSMSKAAMIQKLNSQDDIIRSQSEQIKSQNAEIVAMKMMLARMNAELKRLTGAEEKNE